MKFHMNVYYLAAFNLFLGMLISLSGLSSLASSLYEADKVLFVLFTAIGIAFFVIGCLLILRRRLGLQLAAVLYSINIVLLCLPKIYGLVASSQLSDEQLYWLRFTSNDAFGIIIHLFLLYRVYRFLQPVSTN
jgi:hypothetical protein